MWKTPVVNASDRIFPGLVYHDRKKEFYDIRNQVKSNLSLQIALYCNVCFFPLWFLVLLYSLDSKYYELSEVFKIINVLIFVIISVFECARLYLGYLGNLSEKIPELAGFWLISVLMQFPLELYLLLDTRMLPGLHENIANAIMVSLVAIEIVVGTTALRNLAHHHEKRYYMAQFFEIDDQKPTD